MYCAQKMEALIPNTTETAGKKHLPIVTVKDGAIHVNVGDVNYPMTDEHCIQCVYIKTENGGQRRAFKSDDASETSFCVEENKPIAFYAYLYSVYHL